VVLVGIGNLNFIVIDGSISLAIRLLWGNARLTEKV